MTMTTLPEIIRFGLPGIDRVPMGMHTCHFYASQEELLAALIPYISTGLSSNERCVWITAPPLPARDAISALCKAWPRAGDALKAGDLRVIDFDQWYVDSNGFKGASRVIAQWLEEEERALGEGYTGIRITGNTSFLKPEEWPAFMAYERQVTGSLSGRRIVALCSYLMPQGEDRKSEDVVHAHHCALECRDSDWQIILPDVARGL